MPTTVNVISPVGLPFPPNWALSVLLTFNASVVVEVLFYGIHFILFCICMYILIRNQRSTHWFIPSSAFVLFALSTADVAISIRLITHNFLAILGPGGIHYYHKAIYPKLPIFVVNNFIAELILLYRCYVIWGRSKYLLCCAGLLVVGDLIWGLLVLLTSRRAHPRFVPVYRWSLFAINIVLTAITVGRIFWVSRIAQSLGGGQDLRRHRTIIAILMETSAIYSACLLALALFHKPYSLVMGSICARMVTIMPTLLIVQLGLGRTIRDTEGAGDCDAHATSVVLDSFVTTSIDTVEGTAIPVTLPSSAQPIREDQHGIITSDRGSLPSRPNDDTLPQP